MSLPLHFCVYINSNCERYCPTCYYENKFAPMDLRMAEKVGIWITNLLRDRNTPYFRVAFVGGEPTLNFDVMMTIIQTVLEKKPPLSMLAPRSGFHIFTNGDYFTTEMLTILKKFHVYILLNPTYDSLDEIERKMKFITETRQGCSLAVALDDQNLDRLPELAKLCLKYKGGIRPNRLYHGATIPGYINKYKEQMKKMFTVLLESYQVIHPNFLMEGFPPAPELLRPPEAERSPHPCGHWFYAIDPDGSIRSCNADPDTKIGSIFTHFSEKELALCSNKFEALPECDGCEWESICQSGCPYTRKLAYGTYNRKSPFCEALKELYPMLMQLTENYRRRIEK